MKTVQLHSLTLLNFKGIRKKTIEFGQETSVFGRNRAGKTTLEDAWNWLLFGKDATGRTTFEIKTLDKNNKPIPKIDHEVEAVISIDGEKNTIKRTFVEKWVTRRGSTEVQFKGHETEYTWNGVPMTMRDFNIKISEIIDESTFKLITSPAAFNALPWQDQRKALIAITGEVSDQDVAKGNEAFEKLLEITRNKTIKGYEKELKASIKKSKEELKTIPTRIDEVERNKPEEKDWSVFEKELKAAQNKLDKIDSQIQDKLKADEEVQLAKRELQNSIYELERNIDDAKHQARLDAKTAFNKEATREQELASELKEVEAKTSKSRGLVIEIKEEIRAIKESNEALISRNNKLKEDWVARNAEVFEMDPEDCACPTCERKFEADILDDKRKTMGDNFRESQKRDLEDLNKIGKANKKRIDLGVSNLVKLEERLKKGEAIIGELEDKRLELQTELTKEQERETKRTLAELETEYIKADLTIPEHQKNIQSIREEMEELKPADTKELKEKKTVEAQKMLEIKEHFAVKKTIEDAEKRIDVLGKQEQKLAQSIADMEGEQFLIEQFTKAKMDRLEAKINERFEIVEFKLFETQINEGEKPTCKALIDGVPYSDANTESKIIMGIDIINTLSNHYQVSCPIFIDNRESVTEIIPSKSQIINLVVSPQDKELRVETESKQLQEQLF